jgi:hypothetical protein
VGGSAATLSGMWTECVGTLLQAKQKSKAKAKSGDGGAGGGPSTKAAAAGSSSHAAQGGGSDNEADDDQAESVDTAHVNPFAALGTGEAATQFALSHAEADAEPRAVSGAKRDQEQRKERQSLRKAEEARAALEEATALLEARGPRCVRLLVICVRMRCHRKSATSHC